MAVSKADALAAKQAKQKKILIVLSVVLLAVLAIQLPKLMGGNKSSTSAAPTTTTPGAATPTPTAGTPTVAPVQTPTLGSSNTPKAGKAQLASFSLFEAKDPFVQQIKVDTSTTAGAGPAGAPSGSGGGTAPGGTGGGKPAKDAPTFATITVNGEAQPLQVKGLFPVDDPLFKLIAVSAKTVKITIAGGKLAHGKAVTLKKGDKLTLVDTATGARYTLELVYTGTAPEETAAFTTGQDGTAAPAPGTATPPATTTTTTTTQSTTP